MAGPGGASSYISPISTQLNMHRHFGLSQKEGVAELKFWNFNVPYKAYMALTNVKTLQLWKFCNTLYLMKPHPYAVGWGK